MNHKEFFTPPVAYDAPASINSPFQEQKNEWNGIFGNLIKERMFYKTIVSILSLAIVVAIIALVALSLSRKYEPIFIKMNETNGQIIGYSSGNSSNFGPTEGNIRYFLTEMITWIRSVSEDKVKMGRDWQIAHDKYFSAKMAKKLDELTKFERDELFKNNPKLTIDIFPLNITRIGDSRSYNIRWREIVVDEYGNKQLTVTMLGNFTIEINKPSEYEEINANPVGIQVVAFNWQKELG